MMIAASVCIVPSEDPLAFAEVLHILRCGPEPVNAPEVIYGKE